MPSGSIDQPPLLGPQTTCAHQTMIEPPLAIFNILALATEAPVDRGSPPS
jgi:hypothetical protein